MHRIKAHSLSGLLLLCMFFAQNGFSAYVEGIDTTDVNGYALDSTFNISATKGIVSCSSLMAQYSPYSNEFYGHLLLLNYSFDDIKIACGNKYYLYRGPLKIPVFKENLTLLDKET